MLDWKNLVLETRVNGETRQKQNTSELIFDIPTLIETCSMGITLQPGDVIATGTPGESDPPTLRWRGAHSSQFTAGVGIGKSPPIFLKSGDLVEVEITGLGVLRNVVGSASAPPPTCAPVRQPSVQTSYVPVLSEADPELTQFNSILPDSQLRSLKSGGQLHINAGETDAAKKTVIFVHGLGGSSTNYEALIDVTGLRDTHNVVSFDLEGHGLSPLSGEEVSVESYAQSVASVLDSVGAKSATVVAHSMGGVSSHLLPCA